MVSVAVRKATEYQEIARPRPDHALFFMLNEEIR